MVSGESFCNLVFPLQGEHAEQKPEGFRLKTDVQRKMVLQYPPRFAVYVQGARRYSRTRSLYSAIGTSPLPTANTVSITKQHNRKLFTAAAYRPAGNTCRKKCANTGAADNTIDDDA